MSERDDTLDVLLAAAMRKRPEHAPAFDLAAEARGRSAAGLSAVGIAQAARLMRLTRWVSAGALMLIAGVIGVGWRMVNHSNAQASNGSIDSQVVMVETASSQSSPIGIEGLGLLTLVLAGSAVAWSMRGSPEG